MTSSAPQIPLIDLNDGRAIPQLGFGTYQVPPADTEKVVSQALEAGYRHLDTAQMYGNEEGVGRAVAASGVPREELWITTKLNNSFHERSAARESIERSLEALGGRIDLFLVHWPLAMHDDVARVWEVMEEIRTDFPVDSVGVSNFTPANMARLSEAGLSTPTVNQIESNPYFVNDEVRAACADRGIAVEAWSPLAQGAVFDDPQLTALAEQVGRSISQVVLRWVLQRGDIVFPKSSSPERMSQNLELFDFELTEEQMGSISSLHNGTRSGPDPDTFDWRG
ncbi:aldo/keto reductase [Dietzia sp. PP-33]|jgi:2,5-diketo-D-gluconate reductase A|uniref:aldo/keto reductase n=1 Tax=Dietzia sp. PP-33 TaxID=2957500 RepID=UPI0029AB7E05|nr:aldo/keto reductase [Dietzia sp. PP-33]MDX2355441.1 aldo/keto reductase [Dietzia sp. PP-33]